MKLKQHALSLALVAALTGTSVMAQVPQKGANQGAPAAATPSSQAVENLATAASLVRYGDANKDALSLITAARIMVQTGSSPSSAEVVQSSPAQAKADKQSVTSVLARAKTYAGQRPDLLALIGDVEQSAARGATNGPGQKTTIVGRGMTDVYRVRFDAGQQAIVLVSGDGDSDLDLFVLDENGREVCRDDDSTDQMVCTWTPRWSGPFTIRVRNLGMANEYTIRHN